MSLFKKPKKSTTNRRIFSSENVSENVEKSDIEIKDSSKFDQTNDKNEKSIISKPQKKSLLSFGDEGKFTF